jgi:hypothetical protein
MKLIIILTSLFLISSAHASYMATHCSNSDASVTWETGHNSNTITFKRYQEKDVTLPFYELKVKFLSNTAISEANVHQCGFFSSTKVFAGKVLITASSENPSALDFLGEEKELKTAVICTTHINGRAPCPEETI